MYLVLGFLFECFLYRCVECGRYDFDGAHLGGFITVAFFLLAILVHCAKHKAVVQLVIAGILAMLVLCCFIIYWLITEPCNDIESLEHRFVTVTGERVATTD